MILVKPSEVAGSSVCFSETKLLNIIVATLLIILEGCSFDHEQKRYYEGVTLDAGVQYASARRWDDHGLEWLTQRGTQVEFQQRLPVTQAMEEAKKITILIHGYHAPDTSIATYFEGLVTYLISVKGYGSPIIVFDWPSNARHWEELSNNERIALTQLGSKNPPLSWETGEYAADSILAKSTGVDALIELIKSLSVDRPDRKFNIVAHSMGCLVVLEAIKKNPQMLSSVQTVVWLAPDLMDDVLEDPAFAKGLSNLEKLNIFYSNNDSILAFLSRILHLSISHPMLGSHGPSNINELPDNVVPYDLSDVLGKEGVHSRYLEKESAAAVLIGQALEGSF